MYQNDPDEQIQFRIESNSGFKRSNNHQLTVQIKNKENVIHETLIDIQSNGTQSTNLAIPVKDIYQRVPNGGVLIFKVQDKSTEA